MKIILSTLKKILFWSYERGTWQYDVMCVLILAFIVLVPNRLLETTQTKTLIVRSDEIGQIDSDNLERAIEDRLRQKYGRDVRIARIEKAEDGSGGTSYVVWEK